MKRILAIASLLLASIPLAAAASEDDGGKPKPASERGVEIGATGTIYGMPIFGESGMRSLAFLGGGVRVSLPIADGKLRLGILGEGFRSIDGLYGGAVGAEIVKLAHFGIFGIGGGLDTHWLMLRRNTTGAFMSFLLVGAQGVAQLDLARLGDATLVFDVRPRVDLYWLGLMYGGTVGFAVRLP